MSQGAGSSKDQAARKAAQLERARTDPQYSRVMYGTWPPPASGTPITAHRTAAAAEPARPRKPAAPRPPRRRRGSIDEAYRQALGIPDGQPLPAKLGQADSAGGARGGRGSAQKGKGTRK